MKATKHFFADTFNYAAYKVLLPFESVDEILCCDHSNKATEHFFAVVLFIMPYKWF